MSQAARTSRFVAFCLLPLLPLFAGPAQAGGERQLLAAINDYRGQPRRCENRQVRALAPLQLKASLALPLGYAGRLRETLKAAGYPALAARTIRLGGAADAQAAFARLRSAYCAALLDPQFADIGVSRRGHEWRVVLAKPLLGEQLGDWRAAGKALLSQVNAARAQPRQCGRRRFAATRPLAWNAALGAAAQEHSRAMADASYFAHQGPDGDSPAERARAAGYRGRQIGENIAAGQGSPRQALAGWLASPGHCANLMNPRFTQVGAAYAAQPRSAAGIYWTMLFGAP